MVVCFLGLDFLYCPSRCFFIKFSLPPEINDNIYQKEPIITISVQCERIQHNCTSELLSSIYTINEHEQLQFNNLGNFFFLFIKFREALCYPLLESKDMLILLRGKTGENNRVRIEHKQNAPDSWEFACKNYC